MDISSYPTHVLDYLLWPVLRLVWEPLSKKRSHFWHWAPFKQSVPDSYYARVDPDLRARPRDGWWSTFWNTNFGWRKVAVLRSPFPKRRYRIGFVSREGGVAKREVCACVVKGNCAVLIVPHRVEFFAVEHPGGHPIPLDLARVTVKSLLEEEIPLL